MRQGPGAAAGSRGSRVGSVISAWLGSKQLADHKPYVRATRAQERAYFLHKKYLMQVTSRVWGFFCRQASIRIWGSMWLFGTWRKNAESSGSKRVRRKIERERLAASLEIADVSEENWADTGMLLAERTVWGKSFHFHSSSYRYLSIILPELSKWAKHSLVWDKKHKQNWGFSSWLKLIRFLLWILLVTSFKMFLYTGTWKAAFLKRNSRSSVWFWLNYPQSKFRMSGSKLSIGICDFPVLFFTCGYWIRSSFSCLTLTKAKFK